MSTPYILSGIAVMAVTTYLIRMLPMVLFRRKIESRWLRSFLYYIPYTVLAAMTFPAVFYSTGSVGASVAGCAVAIALAFFGRGLLAVAVGASAAAFIAALLGL